MWISPTLVTLLASTNLVLVYSGSTGDEHTSITKENHTAISESSITSTITTEKTSSETCGKNERYEECPRRLRAPQKCQEVGFPCENCDWEYDDKCDGIGACVCIDKYVRDDDGVCMPAHNCPSCGGDTNATLGSGMSCGRRCSDYMKDVKCLEIYFENECDCRVGYVLDVLIGKCVLPNDCSNHIKEMTGEWYNKNDGNDIDGNNKTCGNKESNSGQCGPATASTPSRPSTLKCYFQAEPRITSAIIAFNGKVLQEMVRVNPGENVLATGPAIFFLLVQLVGYASEAANKQIMETFNLKDIEHVRCFFEVVTPILLKSSQLKFIHKIYSDDMCPVTDKFRQQTRKTFYYEPRNVHFMNPEAARTINKEVAESTENHFINYIKPNYLSKLSGLILISATYFKAPWEKSFDPQLTKSREFYVSMSKTIEVPTMYLRGKFLYTDSMGIGARVLKLKYAEEGYSLVIILPYLTEGLKYTLEKIIEPMIFVPTMDNLRVEDVEIYLPRFNITTANRMKYYIEKKTEINAIFYHSTSGLENITRSGGTYVSEILQKQTFQVDELGTDRNKAVDFDTEDIPEAENWKTYVFRADHPFIYMQLYEKMVLNVGVFTH